jgi:hypothetical protein
VSRLCVEETLAGQKKFLCPLTKPQHSANLGTWQCLTLFKEDLASTPLDAKVFLSGPAGCGKTTAGVERMKYLLAQGVRADSLLVLTPQRTLQEPYLASLRGPGAAPGGEVTFLTLGGLSRRVVDLFWPLAAEAAGFAHPEQPPVFLNLETSQYYMAHIVRPLLEEGYFESVTIDRNRLYSQILDNLNKSAVVGFPVEEIGSRLDCCLAGRPGPAPRLCGCAGERLCASGNIATSTTYWIFPCSCTSSGLTVAGCRRCAIIWRAVSSI